MAGARCDTPEGTCSRARGSAASGTLSVATGATAAEVAGRAFIVHAYDGSRIACALLGEGATLSAADFVGVVIAKN